MIHLAAVGRWEVILVVFEARTARLHGGPCFKHVRKPCPSDLFQSSIRDGNGETGLSPRCPETLIKEQEFRMGP